MLDFLYGEFYSNSSSPQYADGEPETARARDEFQKNLSKIEAEIKKEIEAELHERFKNDQEQKGKTPFSLLITSDEENYWFNVRINGGIASTGDAVGRLYFNCNLKQTPDFFKKLATSCAKVGVRAEIKMPCEGDAHSLNRTDKMVLYFIAEDERKILDIVEEAYAQNKNIFNDEETPRFTEKIKNARGNVMRGIGFGEEPITEGESFGTIRTRILLELLKVAKRDGYLISDPNFNAQDKFKEICEAFGVDPKNPAFNNVHKDGKDFSEIRKRSHKDTANAEFAHSSSTHESSTTTAPEGDTAEEIRRMREANRRKLEEIQRKRKERILQEEEKYRRWKEKIGGKTEVEDETGEDRRTTNGGELNREMSKGERKEENAEENNPHHEDQEQRERWDGEGQKEERRGKTEDAGRKNREQKKQEEEAKQEREKYSEEFKKRKLNADSVDPEHYT